MSCDKLVFDLSQEVEGSPNVFIRKDWLNILDNQNQNYQNNQSIIDTSQLANSNKYMGYREAYLAVPMLLSMRTFPEGAGVCSPGDFSFGLKNWFGSIINSMTLDYNGTTIVQQTPFCNMWNSFKLLTTLSWVDIATQGPTIGFYPDTPDSFFWKPAGSAQGIGITNNDDATFASSASTVNTTNNYNQFNGLAANVNIGGNSGLTCRTKWIAYDPSAFADGIGGASTYGASLLSGQNSALVWRSYISNKSPSAGAGEQGILQISVMATIYLKHVHSFFNMCPLLKGVFMKLTLNLNNSRTTVTLANPGATPTMTCASTSSYIGGVQPILVPSLRTGNAYAISTAGAGNAVYDLMVGSQTFNNDITNPVGGGPLSSTGQVSKSVYLYVPAYTFNPTFEQAYLSNNIKQIKYTDIYQYQVTTPIASGGQFNQLITNGIANIKSVLVIPFFNTNIGAAGSPLEFLSPFDPAGCGPTAPMVALTNFNVQISGQNAIYNMQRYSFEEWNNQLYGQNAVNGGLTDGLTSGLIDFAGFQNSYSYYYVNVERMLPVEQSVPKSVQILGTNYSQQPINLWVFVEYGVEVSIDVLTGARV